MGLLRLLSILLKLNQLTNKVNNMKALITILVVIAVIAVSFNLTYKAIKKDYSLYKLESACVMKQVLEGTPRKGVVGCDYTNKH